MRHIYPTTRSPSINSIDYKQILAEFKLFAYCAGKRVARFTTRLVSSLVGERAHFKVIDCSSFMRVRMESARKWLRRSEEIENCRLGFSRHHNCMKHEPIVTCGQRARESTPSPAGVCDWAVDRCALVERRASSVERRALD